jgi:hypothetical protein
MNLATIDLGIIFDPHPFTRVTNFIVTFLTPNLFCLVILLLFTGVPEPASCLIPPHAPTRGFYESCWTFWELWI